MSKLNYSIETFTNQTHKCSDITMPALAVSSCSPDNIISIKDFSDKRKALLTEYTKKFDAFGIGDTTPTPTKIANKKCLLENIVNLIETNKNEVEKIKKQTDTLKTTIDTNAVAITENERNIHKNEGYKLIKENRLVSSGENKNAVNKEFIIYIVLIVLFLVIQICLIVF